MTHSKATWSVTDEGILGGFEQVHGIGDKTSKVIVRVLNQEVCACGHAPHGSLVCGVRYPWGDDYRFCKCLSQQTVDRKKGWRELQKIAGIGGSTIEKIESFVKSKDPYQVNRTGDILDGARQAIAGSGLPTPTHHSTVIPQTGQHDVVWVGMARNLNYKDFVEATRTRTGKDEDEIIANMKDAHLRKSCVVQCYDEGDEDVYIRVNRWNFPDMEADLESLHKDSDVIVVMGRKREDFGISIHAQHIWVLQLQDEDALGEDTEEMEMLDDI